MPTRVRRLLARLPPVSLPIVFAVLGADLALAREIGFGAALSSDGLNYVAVARNLLAGEGFAQDLHGPYVHWPPLYPALLAAASLFAFDPYDAAGPLNAAIFGLTIFVVARYLRERLESRALAAAGGLALALAWPLVELAGGVWSEPAFVLFATLALIQLERRLRGGPRRALILSAVFAALAWLTRYPGAAVPAAAIFLLAMRGGIGWRGKLREALAYAAIAGLPACLWMFGNLLRTGELRGGIRSTGYSLADIPRDLAAALGDWALRGAPAAFEDWRTPLGALVLALLAAASAWCAVRWRAAAGGGQAADAALAAATVAAAFAWWYLALLIASIASGGTAHGVWPRYLAPLYVPLLTIALLAADRALRLERRRWPPLRAGRLAVRPLALLAAAALTLWLAHAANLQRTSIPQVNAFGSGYTQPRLAHSETAAYVRDHPLDGTVGGNVTELVAFHNRGDATYYVAPESLPPVPTNARQWLTWRDDIPPDEDAWIVWFHSEHRERYSYGSVDLLLLPGVETVASLFDGVVLRVPPEATAVPRTDADRAERYVRGVVDAAGSLEARSAYDVYANSGVRALTWFREPCVPDDTAARFFLHVYPEDASDLPAARAAQGFDNLNFDFGERHGLFFDGKCWVTTDLPAYPVARVRTGQYDPASGRLWETEFAFGEQAARGPDAPPAADAVLHSQR